MSADKERLSALVVRLQQGDGNAFEEIYNLTRESAYFTALKISKNENDAEDILQETYIHILERINTLENPEVFQSWFNQAVANKAKDFLRKNHPERYTSEFFINEEGEEVSKFDLMADDDETFIPEASTENTELCDEVMKMVDSLSDDKRTAVVLYYYDNMTTKQIAESLGVNENTVKSRLVQAKKDLAKSVTEYEKKHGKLLGVAPMPLVAWALKAAAGTAASASVASGAASATLAAVTAGTAVAGTAAGVTAGAGAAAGTGAAAKIIAAIVAAAIVGGGAIAGTRAIINNRNNPEEETTMSQTSDSSYSESRKNEKSAGDDDTVYIIPKDKKRVDTEVETRDFGYGVTGYVTKYTVKTKNGTETREYTALNRSNYSATYDDLKAAAIENGEKYSSQAGAVLDGINGRRNSFTQLSSSGTLSEQAGVRAEEIALSGVKMNVRPDGTSYKTVFEKNGYTAGARKEIIAADCSSPGQAVEILTNEKNLSAVTDPLVTEIGVGVAQDPETGRFVYVVHLYAPMGRDDNDDYSRQESGLKIYSALEDASGNVMDNADSIVNILENTPVLREISKIDIPVDGLFMFISEKLQDLSDAVSQTD